MKLPYLLFLTLFVPFSALIAQNNHTCSTVKKASFLAAKNNMHKSLPGQENYNLNYVKLDLTVDNLSTEIDYGVATLKGTIVAPSTDLLVLELANEYTVDSVKVNGISASKSHTNNVLNIYTPTSLSNNQSFTINVFYHGMVPSNGGFFGGIFNASSPSWGAQATWTLSEPFSAYTWWPCKQDLQDKIDSCDIWLSVPNNLKAGSNGVLINQTALPNGKTRFEWKHRHPIDFYLISFAVSTYIDYSYNALLPDGSQVLVQNFIYNNPNTLANFQADIDETGEMLYALSDLYGPYPFKNEKYGHCMAPLSGGMEHQTMTTQGFFETTLTAHELGHQWFGDNVTCQTWGHIWVNEGFASYSEYLYLDYSNQGNPAQYMQNIHNNVMNQTGGSVYVYNQNDENAIFDSRLVYDKGSTLVHMIRHWVNDDDLFFQAFKDYQIQFANATATAEDFINVLENTTETDMSDFLNHWYYGEGFPTYSGAFNNTNSGFVLRLDQNTSTSVTPFFKSWLELNIVFTDGSDSIVRILNSQNNQLYTFNFTKEVDAVFADPNNWVLNKSNGFNKDANLEYTSIKDLVENKLKVFPNPSDNYFIIEGQDFTDAQLQIYDSKGSLVFSKDNVSTQSKIEHNLECGMYVVQIINDNFTFSNSLIVK